MVEGLTFFYNNIRSVSTNLGDLEILLAESKPSVIALTETWFKNENDVELYSIDGYHRPFTSTRNKRRGGGVAIYVTLDLEAELIHTDEIHESVSVKISDSKKKKKITVSCFYCEPSRNRNQYLEHVEEVLMKNGDGLQIACGDFNIDLLNVSLAARVTLEYLMSSQGLDLVSLREPTRETAASSTCIDSIYSNVPVQRSLIVKTTFSDHYSLKLDINIYHEVVENIYEFRSLKKLEDPLYCEKFLFYLSHSLGKIDEVNTEAEAYLDKVAQLLHDATDKYFPLNKVKRRVCKETWITNRIKRQIATRDKLYQLWIKTKTELDHEKYKKKRNEVNMEIKIAKRNEVQNKIEQNNPKELYRHFKKMKGTDTQVKNFGGLSVEDFNKYFVTACDKQNNTSAPKWKSQQVDQPQSMFLRPVNDDEILKIIATLKNKKSVGKDGVDVRVLKKAAQIVSPYLKTAFNKCISEGVFPQSMKIAKVVPIFKAGEKNLPSNYRPISILGNLSKVFEKVIHERLMNYLEKFSLLSENQYGFRKKKNCIQAATSLYKKIEENWQSKAKTNCIFVDFRKAFDSVDHKILLEKLYHYGIRGIPHKLLENYLANRFQYVKIENECSKMRSIKRGVPQGSILGPLLFLVYINDLGADENWQSEVVKYADDTVMIEKLNSRSDDKSLFQSWLNENDVDCNYMKTKFVVFEKRSVNHPNIAIGDHEISSCENYKYLGIHFDKKLNFEVHISKITGKLARQSGILYKLRETLNKRQLVQYIRSYISPIIQYGVLLYGLSPKTRLQKIMLLQKKIIRIAFRLPPRASVMAKFKELKIGTVFEYHIYEVFKYSINEIRNGFKNLKIGAQTRQTRNRSLNVWNFAAKTDRLDSHAIILMNALRKWGVLPSEENICEMDEKQVQNFYHQISDLYIFGNGELIDLLYNR